MDKTPFNQYPQFFTATILEWKHLLAGDSMEDIIIESMRFVVREGRFIIFGLVIMPNHIHLIWQIQDNYERHKVQQRFLKYTAQLIKFRMIDAGDATLEDFKVQVSDREYQFRERNPLSTDLWSRPVFMQKLQYIHKNQPGAWVAGALVLRSSMARATVAGGNTMQRRYRRTPTRAKRRCQEHHNGRKIFVVLLSVEDIVIKYTVYAE